MTDRREQAALALAKALYETGAISEFQTVLPNDLVHDLDDEAAEDGWQLLEANGHIEFPIFDGKVFLNRRGRQWMKSISGRAASSTVNNNFTGATINAPVMAGQSGTVNISMNATSPTTPTTVVVDAGVRIERLDSDRLADAVLAIEQLTRALNSVLDEGHIDDFSAASIQSSIDVLNALAKNPAGPEPQMTELAVVQAIILLKDLAGIDHPVINEFAEAGGSDPSSDGQVLRSTLQAGVEVASRAQSLPDTTQHADEPVGRRQALRSGEIKGWAKVGESLPVDGYTYLKGGLKVAVGYATLHYTGLGETVVAAVLRIAAALFQLI